jgi:hypothetical protein
VKAIWFRESLDHLEEWQTGLRSLRTVCKRFAASTAINGALFHDFTFYNHTFSISKLQALADSNLKQFVKRIIFMRPQFSEEFRALDSYVALLEGQVEQISMLSPLYSSPTSYDWNTGQLFYEEDRPVPQVPRSSERYAEYEAGHNAYIAALDEQMFVLNNYELLGVDAALSKFSRPLSLVISGTDATFPGHWHGSSWGDVGVLRTSFIAHRFPDAKLGFAKSSRRFLHTESNSLMVSVFECVTRSHLSISSLELNHGVVLTPALKLSFPTKPSFSPLEGMRALHIDIGRDRPFQWDPTKLSSAVSPLVVDACTSLEIFEICGASSLASFSDDLCIDVLLELTFPRLRRLMVQYLCTTKGRLADFIQRHKTLQHADLAFLSEEKGHWRHVFRALRELPGWKRISLMDSTPGFSCAWSVQMENRDSAYYDDLDRYLRGHGEWTENLIANWGNMED